VLAGYAGLEERLACLGKHKTGRSCLYLGSLDKIELNVLGEIVTDGVAHMRKHFGNLDNPYADFACLRRGKAGFPVQGGPEILRALMYQPDEDGRYAGIGGDSFMLIVKWPKDGSAPQTQTIYPFGAAMSHPEAPHYSDQSEMFSKEEFKVNPLPVHK